MKGLGNEGLDVKKLSDPGNRYELGEIIGSGVYADVYKAFDKETNKNVAIKVVRLHKDTKDDVEEEYKILRDLSDHPNLPDFYGIYLKKSSSPTKQDEIWFVMQLCEGGSVIDMVKGLIEQNRRISEMHIAFIIRETLKALNHLHEYHVIHRDVKGSNILLTKSGEVKLVDFGISRELPSTLGKGTACIGTPEWMAPEIVTSKVKGEAYDNRADVWSLGITAIELGDSHSPYHGMHPTRVLFQIVRNPPPTLYRPANWTQDFNDFIAECLVKNPEHRPFLNELFEHPFLTQLPENDFHLSTELKVLMESVQGTKTEAVKEMKVKLGGILNKEGQEIEPLIPEDLSALDEVTEDTILQQIETRYKNNHFYTYIGDVLMFLNPNQDLNTYGFAYQNKYKQKSRCNNEPHVFGAADAAYQDMLHHEMDQHIILTGETMSGKTHNYNMLLKQLLFLGQSGNKVGEKITAAMDIISAFGNATTPSNPNSTRHILHTEVTYGSSGKTSGAIFWLYQLEKWRITGSKTANQNNFHILYYLYDSLAKADTLDKYELKGNVPRYLGRNDTETPFSGPKGESGLNVEKFQRIEDALSALSIEHDQRDTIWRCLSAILLLGEIEFEPGDDDMASISNPPIVDKVSKLLKLDLKKLSWALVNYCAVEESSAVRRKHTVQDANRARHALARSLYSRLVDWLVNVINLRLSFNRMVYGDGYCITLTDYFGFECFPKNGLEQLIVNTFNEQMHFYYNQKIFISEMQEQMAEEVNPWRLQYHDNKGTLDELLNKPHGVMYLIDEAAKTDQGYDFVNESLDSKKEVGRVKSETDDSFSVAHYTGTVTYQGASMVEKDRDLVPPELIEVMRRSTDKDIKAMYTNKLSKTGNVTIEVDPDGLAPKANQTKKRWGAALASVDNKKMRRFNTLTKGEYSQTKAIRPAGSIFRATSLEILRLLAGGSTQFVHCIRTSLNQGGFQQSLVRQQLRAQSIVETVSARKVGFSHRIPFNEFLKRYKFLAFDFDENVDETMDNCRLLLVRLKLEGYLMGKTKIFLKYYNEEYLSRLYENQVKKIIKVQAMLRAFLAKRTIATKRSSRQASLDGTVPTVVITPMLNEDEAATIIQKNMKGFCVRKHYGPLLGKERDEIVKRYAKKWKNKSIFQILLWYRQARHMDMVYLCQEVHIYNVTTLGHIKKLNTEKINISELKAVEQKEFIGESLPVAWKHPFSLRETMPYIDSTPLCQKYPEENEPTFWDEPFKGFDQARRRSEGLSSVRRQENVSNFVGTPYCRDPYKTDNFYASQQSIEMDRTPKKKKYDPAMKPSSPTGSASYNRFAGRTPSSPKKHDVVRSQAVSKSESSSIDFRKNLKKTDRPDPIKEMKSRAPLVPSSSDENDNEEPPFNFQAMLKKTPYKRDSLRRGNSSDGQRPDQENNTIVYIKNENNKSEGKPKQEDNNNTKDNGKKSLFKRQSSLEAIKTMMGGAAGKTKTDTPTKRMAPMAPMPENSNSVEILPGFVVYGNEADL